MMVIGLLIVTVPNSIQRSVEYALRAWFVLLAGTMTWVGDGSLPDVGSTASGKSNVNNALSLAGNLCA